MSAGAELRGKSKKRAWFESRYSDERSSTPPLCKFFSTSGKCRNGTNCPFSHEQPGNQKLNQPCRFLYQIPYKCSKGDLCHFEHDLSKFKCPHRFGRNEDNCIPLCKFDHTPIRTECEKMMFVRTFHPFLSGLGNEVAELWQFYLREWDEYSLMLSEVRQAPDNFFFTESSSFR